MRIGLIDVDGHNFPNIPLMKISAYHKAQGHSVEWYNPILGSLQEPMDKVYVSKIFSFTDDIDYYINAKEVQKGGSGYCIELVDGKEIYHAKNDKPLPEEVEHTYPDYDLYGITDTAYGFLSRGCPRGCEFCHVEAKEGRKSYKVADLTEFWRGQKNITICDPNIIACKEWKDLLQQLIDSKAYIDINQGIDIRIMTEEKAEMVSKLKLKDIHFAWDKYEDKENILPKFEMFKDISKFNDRKMIVYVLCNFNTTIEQDLERIYTLRDIGYTPYVMLYDKAHAKKKQKEMARWVNNKWIFRSCNKFEDYVA